MKKFRGDQKILIFSFSFVLLVAVSIGGAEIPKSHQGIKIEDGQMVYVDSEGKEYELYDRPGRYTLSQMRSTPSGTDDGVAFDFNNAELNGKLYYGFIPESGEVKYPLPVYFKRSAEIEKGAVEVDIRNKMVRKYDFINWQQTGKIHLGYRIVSGEGLILYDGRIRLFGIGPFYVDTSIIEGPFVGNLADTGAVISYVTNFPVKSRVIVDDRINEGSEYRTHHEVSIPHLIADTEYDYTIEYGRYKETYHFRTAPAPGTRQPFVFAYASDGRANNGGGERNIRGVNAYMMKKIAALCMFKKARFFQFTGDLINGYGIDPDAINLEYANWKRTVEPFAHYMPFICGFGNHEVLMTAFFDNEDWVEIDKFPYDSVSAEVVFAANFVNPKNGPASEDGAAYDPDPNSNDFPPYEENVFYYTYDNVAVISLNSNYWYSPTIEYHPGIGGNLHGYIMDNQLAWLKDVLAGLESDGNIDHVFVTIHTPIFPNGGHVGDDMWYNGSNEPRPYVAGRPVEKGIIERRDELLDLLMNQSTKVLAVLTGDEHNYNVLKLTEELPIYPDDYGKPRLQKFRPLWLINDGAAGAPYYGKEKTPWTDYLRIFSTQNALVFFYVDGGKVRAEVVNPDTMELIDEFELN